MVSFPALAAKILIAATFFGLNSVHGSVCATELIMVEREGCPYCAKWQRDVGAIYPKSSESKVAPLRLVQLENGQPNVQLGKPVRFTPTFLLVDEGREVGRITGNMNDSMLWGLLDSMLARLQEDRKTAARQGE